jgi:hypothetical protein
MPNDDLISIFQDGLEEVIPEKIKELMDYQDSLVKLREEKLKAIDLVDSVDEASEYFWLLWTEIEFENYYRANRWLKYWLRLATKSGNNNIEEKTEEMNKLGLTQEQIDQAKSIGIQDVFEGRLRKAGSRYYGLCPFHKESTASFVIFENDNSFYCFGCNANGDVLDFYMKLHEVNFPSAVKALI